MPYRIAIAASLALYLGQAYGTPQAAPPGAGAPTSAPQAGSQAVLALLETTDLHGYAVGYDYYKLSSTPAHGLDRTAALIAQARRQYPNNLLLDNGDTIQGSVLAEYQARVAPPPCDQPLAIYRVMNALKYDGASIGNHEFNFGLAFLSRATGQRLDVGGVPASTRQCAGPNFPQVLANVVSIKSGKPLFAPYHIIDKQIEAQGPDGKPFRTSVKVGLIGFAPPAIMSWDRRWLEGKVRAEGVLEAAERYVPELRAKGAQVVVAISHGGLDAAPYTPKLENANYYLAQVAGIDAMLIGHSHQVFPDAGSSAKDFNLPGVDKVRGTVHGVPTVMANHWGKHLGVIALALRHDGQKWVVDRARTTVEARSTQQADKSFIEPDSEIARLVAQEHEAAIEYVKTPIGETDFRMSNYFADVGDVSALQVVNEAQEWYVRRLQKRELARYAKLPVLSMSAPFKSGHGGAADYTDVPAGRIALNHAADLYVYPNTLHVVKVNGAELKAWLEQGAKRLNTIDPSRAEPQELVNRAYPSYNFDQITSPDVRYQIDLTQPAGQRIRDMRYKGKPVGPAQAFLVATNNYRASGGGEFPGLDGSRTVYAGEEANRDVLVEYVKQVRKLSLAKHGLARSWSFAPLRLAGPLVFHTRPGLAELARQSGVTGVTELKADDGRGKGLGLYQLELPAR
jgi:2',3'-cyclic-nucleotide 2'-phosphodiesterase/3'-nucleotidase